MKEQLFLRPVEQSIIFFFVWREMNDESNWYEKGIKTLAKEINRHEKSVWKAIDTLQEMNLIITQKNQNTTWVKHTLSDEELYSRMAFINYIFCQPQAFQELKNDLNQEIARLEDEIRIAVEDIVRKEEQNRIRNSVIQQITRKDIELFADSILADKTFSNVNKTFKEIIENELERFREVMFSKYGGKEEGWEIIQDI